MRRNYSYYLLRMTTFTLCKKLLNKSQDTDGRMTIKKNTPLVINAHNIFSLTILMTFYF
jgi:hypothetical protein